METRSSANAGTPRPAALTDRRPRATVWAGWVVSLAMTVFGGAARGQDMAVKDVLIADKGWELVAEGYQFSEGPAVDRDGNLYFTDVPQNRIHRLNTRTCQVEVFAADTQATNGLMCGPDGRLYGCMNAARQIVAFATDGSGSRETIAAVAGCNDLVVTRQGTIYVTDPEDHRVWYVDADGQAKIVDEGLGFPNGVILWPDQSTLVVADTTDENLWAFRIERDGSLTHKQPYYTLRLTRGQNDSGADGMTMDTAGRLYVATHAGVQMFDPIGRLGGVIHKPQPAFLSNVVLAGPEFSDLYVTSTDKLYRRPTKARGELSFLPREGSTK